MDKIPRELSFWWDFSCPSTLPVKLECNHPLLPSPIITFDGENAVEVADKAVAMLSGLDIHSRMNPDRILKRVLIRIEESVENG